MPDETGHVQASVLSLPDAACTYFWFNPGKIAAVSPGLARRCHKPACYPVLRVTAREQRTGRAYDSGGWRRLRRLLYRLEAGEEASAGRGAGRAGRSAAVHDLPAVSSRGAGRLDRSAARRGVAAPAPAPDQAHLGPGHRGRPRAPDGHGAAGRGPGVHARLRHHRGHRRCGDPQAGRSRRGGAGDRHEACRGGGGDPGSAADRFRPGRGAQARAAAPASAHRDVRGRRVLRRRGLR